MLEQSENNLLHYVTSVFLILPIFDRTIATRLNRLDLDQTKSSLFKLNYGDQIWAREHM